MKETRVQYCQYCSKPLSRTKIGKKMGAIFCSSQCGHWFAVSSLSAGAWDECEECGHVYPEGFSCPNPKHS